MCWVIAKYDFRTKQKYIYRTNAIQEIVGASALITGAYEAFLCAMEGAGYRILKNYGFNGKSYVNSVDAPCEPDEQYDGIVLYVGGGNLNILWKSREIALEASRVLCETILEGAYGLSPVCGIAPYTGHYLDDYQAVNSDFERCKALMSPLETPAMLPITEVDRKTTQPVHEKGIFAEQLRSLSLESYHKRCKYESLCRQGQVNGERNLDKLITKKGTESLLAVIYVDGNNMGQRVRDCMGQCVNQQSYQEAIRNIRAFSNEIQSAFVSEPSERIQELLDVQNMREIIAGGDEMTLIVNARDALRTVKAYFNSLHDDNNNDDNNNNNNNNNNTACAGVCIFHSHSPFATAYRIAEECCENAKKINRRYGSMSMLVDFQFCSAGVTGDLDAIREAEGEKYLARPFFYNAKPDSATALYTIDEYESMAEKLKRLSRKNIKNLCALYLRNEDAFDVELDRLIFRFGVSFTNAERQTAKRMIFDIAQMYDLWFGERT